MANIETSTPPGEFVFIQTERVRKLRELVDSPINTRWRNLIEGICVGLMIYAGVLLVSGEPLSSTEKVIVLAGFSASFSALRLRADRAEKRTEALIDLLKIDESLKP